MTKESTDKKKLMAKEIIKAQSKYMRDIKQINLLREREKNKKILERKGFYKDIFIDLLFKFPWI